MLPAGLEIYVGAWQVKWFKWICVILSLEFMQIVLLPSFFFFNDHFSIIHTEIIPAWGFYPFACIDLS